MRRFLSRMTTVYPGFFLCPISPLSAIHIRVHLFLSSTHGRVLVFAVSLNYSTSSCCPAEVQYLLMPRPFRPLKKLTHRRNTSEGVGALNTLVGDFYVVVSGPLLASSRRRPSRPIKPGKGVLESPLAAQPKPSIKFPDRVKGQRHGSQSSETRDITKQSHRSTKLGSRHTV